MSTDAELLGWAVCANISDHIRGGTDPDRFYQGTKMFSPGTKVYLGSAYWGMGGERIHVLGLRRISRDFVNCVVHIGTLQNIRVSPIYSASTFKKLERLQAELYGSRQEAEKYQKICSDVSIHERPKKLATETRHGPWGSWEADVYRNE